MRPRIVGYGSCGRAPPNSITACFESFDHGADAYATDVCETRDGVLVAAKRRTLRFLAGWTDDVPTWSDVRDADLGALFGGGSTRHRVLTLERFLGAVGPLSMRIRIDGALRPAASRTLEAVVLDRPVGVTTVLAPPDWLSTATLPDHVARVALLGASEDSSSGFVPSDVDAVAVPVRMLPTAGRWKARTVALGCDTLTSLSVARRVGVVAAHTERPAWFRAAWSEDRFSRAW